MPCLPDEVDLDVPESDEQMRIAVAGSVLAVIAGRGDLLQHAHSPDHPGEGRVERRQAGVLPDEEELATVSVRPSVGHRHGAGRIGGAGQVLIIELVAWAAGAGAG